MPASTPGRYPASRDRGIPGRRLGEGQGQPFRRQSDRRCHLPAGKCLLSVRQVSNPSGVKPKGRVATGGLLHRRVTRVDGRSGQRYV